jgi:acyl-CoA synthetase (NDP forming)
MIGPNCLGIANLHNGLNSTPMMLEGAPGYIGLVSQSGSFVTQMFNYLSRLGLGFSSAISVGNEADLDLVDCIEYFARCPHTKVIALYIEGIKRGAEFIRIVRKVSVQKPIVAFYVGGSEAGRKAAFSHTGSLSGPDKLYDGAFKQAGVTRAYTLTELFDYCMALAALPEPKGINIVIQTHSGGPGASAADVCSRSGFNLATLSSNTKEALVSFLPQTASCANPVDVTFSQNQAHYFFDIPKALMQDDALDYLLIYLLMPESMAMTRMINAGLSEEDAQKMLDGLIDKAVKTFIELQKSTGKPIVGFTYRSIQEKMIRKLMSQGIPVYQDPERAAKAMKVVLDYYEMKKRRNLT